jgi:hypothetical protein
LCNAGVLIPAIENAGIRENSANKAALKNVRKISKARMEFTNLCKMQMQRLK